MLWINKSVPVDECLSSVSTFNTRWAVSITITTSQVSKLPLTDRLRKAGECAESNYTMIAIAFASRYCASRGSSANIR